MPFEAFLIVLVLIVVIVLLGIRLLKAQAELALIIEARDRLAEERSEIMIENARLGRESEAWRDGDKIRRRSVRPALTFPEEA